MFNLETAIVQWRHQMSGSGVRNGRLVELESHLREHVQEQVARGVAQEKAFAVAVQALGDPRILAREFGRAGSQRSPGQIIMITLAALFVAFVLFLGGAATFVCYTQPVERLTMVTAVLCTLAVAFNWRLLLRVLPPIPSTGKRLWMITVAMGVCFGIATFYCQVIVPHFSGPGEGLMPALGYFTMIPVAIGFCCVIGFEEAARRHKAA
jgi:hypothetical protein